MPTGLGAFERDGLLREVRAYLDRMDAVLGEVYGLESVRDHAVEIIARALREVPE